MSANNTPPEPVRSLEGRFYTAPELYEKEKAELLARTWQYAGHVSQVMDVGDYFTFEIAGENLFCLRGRDSELRTFYNVCQHRAHELVKGAGNTKVVVCPYHAWTYELTGQLRAGPNIKSVPGFDREKICLTDVRTEIFHGFIFVNLDPAAKPMEDWFPNAADELKTFLPNIDELSPADWVEVPEQCNWKVSVENYNECYHCSLNHPTFSNGVVKPETYDIRDRGYVLRHITESQNLDQMTYPIDLDASPHAAEYSSWFLWPMFSFQVYPGGILNTYHWRPTGVDTVTLWRGWFSKDGEKTDTIKQLAKQDRETTVEEDIHLVESVQRGLKSRGYRPGPLVVDPNCGVNSEHSIRALQQWMREGIEGTQGP